MATTSIFLVGLKAAASLPDYMVENEIIGIDPVSLKSIVRQRISNPDATFLLEEVMLEMRNLGDGNAGQMPNPLGQTRVSIDNLGAGLTLATVTTVGTVGTVSSVTNVANVANMQSADGYRLALDQFYAGLQAEGVLRSRIAVT